MNTSLQEYFKLLIILKVNLIFYLSLFNSQTMNKGSLVTKLMLKWIREYAQHIQLPHFIKLQHLHCFFSRYHFLIEICFIQFSVVNILHNQLSCIFHGLFFVSIHGILHQRSSIATIRYAQVV